ncbi:MAG: DUF4157 domain-containing protein [Alphaproteobacteria bacterium]|nr:MAG: DUF4157 domain-containing protein [Alphaproteobacteria bacterium]
MSKRPLTPGEIALAKTVFGDSVDYARVRLHDKRILPPGIQHKHQAVAKGSDISFPRDAYAADFSAETNPQKQSVFIHELVHVWQHQNRVLSTPREALKETLKHKFNYSKSYLHRLSPDKDLTRYGFEQQAAIIQDFFLFSRHGIAKSYKGRRLTGESDKDLKQQYEKVLAKFLKDPSYARGLRDQPRRPKRRSLKPG